MRGGAAEGDTENVVNRLARYVALKAVAGEFGSVLAAIEVIEGGFRREAEEKYGVPSLSAKSVIKTLACTGFDPALHKWIVDAVYKIVVERGIPLYSPSCPICGSSYSGVSHASEQHEAEIKEIMEAVLGNVERKRGGGRRRKQGDGEEIMNLAREALCEFLTSVKSQRITVKARYITRTMLKLARQKRMKVQRQKLYNAASRILAETETIELNGVSWSREKLALTGKVQAVYVKK